MMLRDMTSPSGADIEAFFNQQIQKIMANISYGAAGGGAIIRAGEYDFQVAKANHHPGSPHWEFVSALAMNMDVYIVWRMSRVKQAELGLTALIKLPEKPAGSI